MAKTNTSVNRAPVTEIEKLRNAWRERINDVLKLAFPETELDIQHHEVEFEGTLHLGRERALHFSKHLYTNRLIVQGTWPRWPGSQRKPLAPEHSKMAASLTGSDEQLAWFIREKWMPFYDTEFEMLREHRDAELEAVKTLNACADELADAAGMKRTNDMMPGKITADHLYVEVGRDGRIEIEIDNLDLKTAKRVLSLLNKPEPRLTPPSK